MDSLAASSDFPSHISHISHSLRALHVPAPIAVWITRWTCVKPPRSRGSQHGILTESFTPENRHWKSSKKSWASNRSKGERQPLLCARCALRLRCLPYAGTHTPDTKRIACWVTSECSRFSHGQVLLLSLSYCRWGAWQKGTGQVGLSIRCIPASRVSSFKYEFVRESQNGLKIRRMWPCRLVLYFMTPNSNAKLF